jgi:hypothetical protein
MKMRVNLSPAVYLTLCGLVKDALEVPSDADPLMRQAALELASVAATELPEELKDKAPAILELQDCDQPQKKSAAA